MKTLAMAMGFAATLAVGAAAAPALEGTDDASLTRIARTLLEEMARNASLRDVKANMHLIPATDKVVYVSRGAAVTGKEYEEGLGEFYASHTGLSHRWDRIEITPIPPNAAAFTGWATQTAESRDGTRKTERVIFTGVFARTSQGWKRVLAQKAVLQDD